MGHQTPSIDPEVFTTYLETHAEKLPPLFIAKAALDHAVLNASIDRFITRACVKNIELDFVIHPNGQHAFDILDNVERSHQIIKSTLEFMKAALIDSSNSTT